MQVQASIEVPPNAEPEPDLVLAARKPPTGRHLRSALLVIEVAVSSHMIDRNVKAELYARAGVPTYWLVDVPGRAIEVRTEPGPDGYSQCEIHRDDTCLPSPLEGVGDLDIAALLADVKV
jgi:Uma2 family endonuclease